MTSVSLEPRTFRDLKALASRRHGGNVLALLAEIASREARFAAAERFFDKYGVPLLDDAALEQIGQEWLAAGNPKKPRRSAV